MSIQNKLEQLLDKLNNGVDFVSGELPDVAKQLIELEKETVFYWVYGLTSAFVLGLVLFIMSRIVPDSDTSCVFKYLGLMLVCISLLLIPIATWEAHFMKVKLRVAPKVYVLEHIMQITRRGGCE